MVAGRLALEEYQVLFHALSSRRAILLAVGW